MYEPIRQSLTAWFEKKQLSSIKLLENLTPAHDQYADYHICYEAVLEPVSLSQSRIEVWVTTDGQIGIGFEQRERIAKLLNIYNYRAGFAAGYEPLPMSIESLIANLENIANGNIAVVASVFPLFGLGRTKAVMLDETFKALREQDENVKYWLHPVRRFRSNPIVHVLNYDRWT